MKLLKGIGIGLCLVMACVLVAPNAKADDSNEKTTIVLTQPVEVPGVGQHLLPAGTYVFKLLNSPVDRHIVEIYNQDETKLLTTVLTITNHRVNATKDSVVTFSERPVGQPQALKAWFFSGQLYGEQFVWDKPSAIEPAQETNEAVVSTPAVTDAAPVEVAKTAPLEAVTPKEETIQTAAVVNAPPVEVATATPVAPPQPALPQTASDLPLIGLAGLLSLGAGLGLLAFSKSKA
jgi:hypothetical protein